MRLTTTTLASLVLLFAWLCSTSQAGQLSLCPAGAAADGDGRETRLFGSQGRMQSLALSDSATGSPDCSTLSLDVAPEELLWATVLPAHFAEAPAQGAILLQGQFPAGAPGDWQVSEVIPAWSEPGLPGLAPLGVDLLPRLQYRVFGIEERARWSPPGRLDCGAGEAAAGVQLYRGEDWALGSNLTLELLASGRGAFGLAVADAAQVAAESVERLGTLQLGDAQAEAVGLPIASERLAAITLLCPPDAARLDVRALRLQETRPVLTGSAGDHRGAWIWSPARWREDPEFYWRIATREGLEELYITVPVTDAGEVGEAAALQRFVAEARERGLKVWPVIGDRRDVLEESLPALRRRLGAYLDYNRSAPADSLLAGVQLDIEPYLLPGFTLDPVHWQERYRQTIAAAAEIAGEELALDLVLPVWWGNHADWGPRFLDSLVRPNMSLTAMNYRTDADRLRVDAQAFLEWGVRHGREVRIALEVGSLADETRRRYQPSGGEGELWRLELGGSPVLLLLREARAGLPGAAYRLSSEALFSASTLTFGGDLGALRSAAAALAEDLRPWQSFGGLSLHGLEEVYQRQELAQ